MSKEALEQIAKAQTLSYARSKAKEALVELQNAGVHLPQDVAADMAHPSKDRRTTTDCCYEAHTGKGHAPRCLQGQLEVLREDVQSLTTIVLGCRLLVDDLTRRQAGQSVSAP